jgi:hypothetical protein
MKAEGCVPSDLVQVAFTGSVLGEISIVRQYMEANLRAALPEVVIAQTPVEPLDGALWRARRG